MNPWMIVSWIGAVSVSILIVTLTISLVRSSIRQARNKPAARIYNSRRHD